MPVCLSLNWGTTPAQALRTATSNAAESLNFDSGKKLGSVKKGKFVDLFAVSGDPLAEMTEMERIKFVVMGEYFPRRPEVVRFHVRAYTGADLPRKAMLARS